MDFQKSSSILQNLKFFLEIRIKEITHNKKYNNEDNRTQKNRNNIY